MNKLDRLVGIIYALKENKRLTAKDISNIFEVSERTIYRDIDALSQLNVPIIAFEGNNGGYEIEENYFIPSIALKNYEVLYLLICLKIGEIIKVPNMKNNYESLKYKILNTLDDTDKNKNLKILERVVFDINKMYISEYRNDIIEKIIDSFSEYKNLIIEYYNPNKDECIERKISPDKLIFFNGGWYLDGYCHLRKSRRLFRLDRIKDIKICDDSYDENNNYSYERNKDSDNIKVTLEIQRNLYETIKNDNIFLNSKVEYREHKLTLEMYTDSSDSIINIAIRNYDKIKIIEPSSLINKLKNICESILEKY